MKKLRKTTSTIAEHRGPEQSVYQSSASRASAFSHLRRSAVTEMILRQVPNAIVISNTRRRITFANAAAVRLADRDPEGMLLSSAPSIWGKMFDAGRNPVPADQWPWMGALRGESTFSKECSLVRTSGRSFNVLFSAAPIRTLSRKIVGAAATLSDITECKRTELIIRSEALCKERGRMAEDIHDTLCQGLHAILLQLQAAEDQFPKNLDEVHRHFLRAQVVARENLTEAQRSLWTLSNEPPETGKFAEALSLIARQLFAASPVTVELHLQDEEPAISPKMQSDLLRIAKEGLVNVLKHAHATKVRIELTFSQRGLCLSVEDNGNGIVHVAARGKPRSFGLTSIRKRAERLGGKVDIESHPGRGTRITLAAPIRSLPEISTR